VRYSAFLNRFKLEMYTFSGRIDCRVVTKDFIYLFEFKRDESAEKALQQINDNRATAVTGGSVVFVAVGADDFAVDFLVVLVVFDKCSTV